MCGRFTLEFDLSASGQASRCGRPADGFRSVAATVCAECLPRVVAIRGMRGTASRPTGESACLEVPVVVAGVLGLADDVRRSASAEEVVVLVGAGGEGGEDLWAD